MKIDYSQAITVCVQLKSEDRVLDWPKIITKYFPRYKPSLILDAQFRRVNPRGWFDPYEEPKFRWIVSFIK